MKDKKVTFRHTKEFFYDFNHVTKEEAEQMLIKICHADGYIPMRPFRIDFSSKGYARVYCGAGYAGKKFAPKYGVADGPTSVPNPYMVK